MSTQTGWDPKTGPSLAAAAKRTRAYVRTFSPDRPRSSRHVLTRRETLVLFLVSEGYTQQVIAARLGVGEKTIRTHLHRIYGVLGAYNAPHAVAIAFRLGIFGVADEETIVDQRGEGDE